ncbi:MAG: class I SAM-dependent methyltransferase [Bacteroidales bacterium]|nr:class I SAM-dependent methyltransferase [Bacteroidales bacterium]
MSSNGRGGNEAPGLRDLADVFSDVAAHMSVAQIIRDHLTNRRDIRETALEGLDLSWVGNILDVGCGFGYFTEGLKGRISPGATATGVDLHPGYSDPYLEACRKCEFEGSYFATPVEGFKNPEHRIFDLILCSYSLYFFPQSIGHIVRSLNKGGIFVAITHSHRHMADFFRLIAQELVKQGMTDHDVLPYSHLISNFSDENGASLLATHFGHVEQRAHPGSLVFRQNDKEAFKDYFRLKSPFFLKDPIHEMVFDEAILDKLLEIIDREGMIRINKDDVIFIGRNRSLNT